MKRALPVLILALLFVVLTTFGGNAGATAHPALKEPFPFDHGVHSDVFRKADISCVTCHPVGLRVPIADGGSVAPDADIQPPLTSCHVCHLQQAKGVPRQAPGTCETCHANRAELKPAGHDATWATKHGDAARARGSDCESCHTPRTCLDCHEKRGPMVTSPHPPGFGSFHGIEARIDPISCSSCHTGENCTACHLSGTRPW